MLNFVLTSTAIASASLVAFSNRVSLIATPAGHSESASLVAFGFGLMALAIFARRAGRQQGE
jgi:hypothetical protein